MKLPRFQFSLRTLFVVVTLAAVPCCYVGWQAKIVRERKAWLQAHQFGSDSKLLHDNGQGTGIIRRWLGDEAHNTIEAVGADDRNEGQLRMALSSVAG